MANLALQHPPQLTSALTNVHLVPWADALAAVCVHVLAEGLPPLLSPKQHMALYCGIATCVERIGGAASPQVL